MTAALIYLAILVVAFFLLIVLPQRRRLAAHRALVDAMDVGDEIVTTAGMHGTIRELGEATIRLEIAPGVVVTIARGAISQRRRPASGASGDSGEEPTGRDASAVEPRPPAPRPTD